MNTDLDTLLTALYVFVSDRVVKHRRLGRPLLLDDAELLCLAIAQVLLGFAGERHWIRYARAHLRHLFPYISQQSGYNKRLVRHEALRDRVEVEDLCRRAVAAAW